MDTRVQEFLDYFDKELVSKHYGWYDSFLYTLGPSTNDGKILKPSRQLFQTTLVLKQSINQLFKKKFLCKHIVAIAHTKSIFPNLKKFDWVDSARPDKPNT